jgi:hypothetical protein
MEMWPVVRARLDTLEYHLTVDQNAWLIPSVQVIEHVFKRNAEIHALEVVQAVLIAKLFHIGPLALALQEPEVTHIQLDVQKFLQKHLSILALPVLAETMLFVKNIPVLIEQQPVLVLKDILGIHSWRVDQNVLKIMIVLETGYAGIKSVSIPVQDCVVSMLFALFPITFQGVIVSKVTRVTHQYLVTEFLSQ